jgi:hypothetical protein
MNYLNKAILNKHKEHWHTLRDAGFIKNLGKDIVDEIELVYKEEIDANFFVNKWCMSCVAEMINTLYQVTKFDTEVDSAIVKTKTQELMEVIELDEASQEVEAVFIEKPIAPKTTKSKYKKKK